MPEKILFDRLQKTRKPVPRLLLDQIELSSFGKAARAELPPGKWVTVITRELDPDQEEQIWDCYGLSYGKVGLAYSSVRELLTEHRVLWCIDVDGDDTIDAFLAYKPTKAGFKITFAGNKGTPSAGKALADKTLQILKTPGWYTESSHQVAKLFESRGFLPLNDEQAVRAILGKDIEWVGDGYYLRNITGVGSRMKGIYGSPRIPRTGSKKALKMAPEPGITTVVSPKSKDNLPTGIDREKEQVLPLPGSATPGGAGRDIPKFEFNTPGPGAEIKPRTTSLPGDQYGVPYKNDYNMPTRRTMTSSLVERYLKARRTTGTR